MGKRTWTDEEYEILRKNFPDGGIYKCMELLPHKTKKQIKGKITALKIKSNKYDKWTEEEESKMKEAWENYTMEELLKAFPGRTYQKIMLKAHTMGYKSKANRRRKTNLSFLDLNDLTPQSLYWWGFIMADGHISKANQLIITLKNVDIQHLEKLANHISGQVHEDKNGFCHLCAGDKDMVSECKDILKMTETAKTYYPPDLSVFFNDFIYFFIGFVDGDGCIWFCRDYPQLKIELHSTWLENLRLFEKILKEKYGLISPIAKLSDSGTSILTIGNRYDIKKISEYCKNVDFLERKWNKMLNYDIIPKKRLRLRSYEEFINLLKAEKIYTLDDMKKTNIHIDRNLVRWGVTKEQVLTDVNK